MFKTADRYFFHFFPACGPVEVLSLISMGFEPGPYLREVRDPLLRKYCAFLLCSLDDVCPPPELWHTLLSRDQNTGRKWAEKGVCFTNL